MAVAPKCDVCMDSHWPHQSHRFAQVLVAEDPIPPLPGEGACEVCGTEFVARRSDARFCGAKCRQVSSRKKRRA